MTERTRAPCNQGFTLLELAIVILVLGLVLAGGIVPLQTQIEARDRSLTFDRLALIRDALLGFAAANGRLPCPDQGGDGRADPAFDPALPASANCSAQTGFLPWSELGVDGLDAWGNRYGYRVGAPRFTRPETDGLCNGNSTGEFDLCARGQISIRGRGDNPQTTGQVEGKTDLVLADDVPALIWSAGHNGSGASGADGRARPAPLGADELDNTDGDDSFHFRTPTRGEAGCSDSATEAQALCEFDDLAVWLPLGLLQERMITAQRLP